VGLKWAHTSVGPGFPPTRKTAAQRAGLRYERAVGRRVPDGLLGPWFYFRDEFGHGYCQPDVVILGPVVVALECKLTITPVAETKLRELYLPILRAVYTRPARGVVVARHLAPGFQGGPVVSTLAAALTCPHDVIPVLHWLGKGPL